MKYVFKPYEAVYKELFLKEKGRLGKVLGEKIQIEHVGSTAVPGLGGKGIIDIAIGANKEKFNYISGILEESGYEFRPNAGTEKRLFFQTKRKDRSGKERTYHIHLADIKGEEWKKMIAFRDYLRVHPKNVNEYANAKRKAAKESNQDKETYMRIKEPVIARILDRALKI